MAPTLTIASSIYESCASPEPSIVDDVSASGNKDDQTVNNKEKGPNAECENSVDTANAEGENAQDQAGEEKSQPKGPSVESENFVDTANVEAEEEDAQNQAGEGKNQPRDPSAESEMSVDATDAEEEDAQNQAGEEEHQERKTSRRPTMDRAPVVDVEYLSRMRNARVAAGHDGRRSGGAALAGWPRPRQVAEDGTANIAPNAHYEPGRNTEEDEVKRNPPPANKPANIQLPPPAWTDVTFDQLVNYPKSSLRAQSFFDLQQIRAMKPLTLITMGISVPEFPDLENDCVIKISMKRTNYQLYYPTDVIPSMKKSKPFLQKEICRRCILHNLHIGGEDVTHNDIPKNKLSQRLPRPGKYTLVQCIEWLKTNPLPMEERAFVLKSAKQWRQQVRDQLGKVDGKTKELEETLAVFDELRTKELIAAPKVDAAAAHTTANTNNHEKVAFEHYAKYLSTASLANPVINRNTQTMRPNVMAYQGQQLAAAVNINNVQAQMISQYQTQLAALQGQAATASNKTQFEIVVSKDTFKFNAAHFVAYPGFRERLHGHNYRVKVRIIGSRTIGRDGYVLDFGCVKSVTKDVCKEMNEFFLVPTLSEVLKITVEEDEDGDGELAGGGKKFCSECDDGAVKSKKTKKRKRSKYPGSVTIKTEDGATFIFPRQDCLLLPILHSTAEELAIYVYGKILQKLDSEYLRKRGVTAMEVTVSEAVGQDAMFRHVIPEPGGKEFDVASYISKEDIPVMPCATETEGANQKK